MILYEGPSLIDGTPIFVAATEDSNPKTGRMLFTWILRQDRPPEVAALDGSDRAICGDCRFRAAVPNNPQTRTCYVRLTSTEADEALAPDKIWQHYRDDLWPLTNNWWSWPGRPHRYMGALPVRIGSYGDPAAVPTEIWAELVSRARHWTGYTHLWRTCDPALKRYCMASVDTPTERAEAQAAGWRTFLVAPHNQASAGTDILCPATTGKSHCAKCLLCMGTSTRATKSIWEIAHGQNKENHIWNTSPLPV